MFSGSFYPSISAAAHTFASFCCWRTCRSHFYLTHFSTASNSAELCLFHACLGNAATLLPVSLAPLPPLVHILLLFRLSEALSSHLAPSHTIHVACLNICRTFSKTNKQTKCSKLVIYYKNFGYKICRYYWKIFWIPLKWITQEYIYFDIWIHQQK